MHTDWDHSTQADDLLYDSMVCSTNRSAVRTPARPKATGGFSRPGSHDSTDRGFHTPPKALPVLDARRMSLARPANRWRYPARLRLLESLPRPSEATRHFVSARLQRHPSFRIHREGLVWLTSFVLHLVLLVLLGLLTVAVHRARAGRMIFAQQELPALETMTITPIAMESWEHVWRGGDGGTVVEQGALNGSPGSGRGTAAQMARLTGPVDDVRALFRERGRALAPTGAEGDGAEFFGVRAAGTRFVFIVDCSRSMSGRRWADACAEVVYSVRRLGPEKFFYVIFFDGQAHPMFSEGHPESGLLAASDENVQRLEQWIARMRVGEDTLPCAAVQLGMHLQPDAMFLLSDGEFSDPTATYLRRNNFVDRGGTGYDSGVVVHTIGFHSRKGQALLQRIARENRGKYQFVSAYRGLSDLSR
ncbi:MAG TPA: hypothetical protein VML55_16115, partial [Planctomycetaceae bacterium]|nr:hypothetical protein [Planctomycetaceae bacterium]